MALSTPVATLVPSCIIPCLSIVQVVGWRKVLCCMGNYLYCAQIQAHIYDFTKITNTTENMRILVWNHNKYGYSTLPVPLVPLFFFCSISTLLKLFKNLSKKKKKKKKKKNFAPNDDLRSKLVRNIKKISSTKEIFLFVHFFITCIYIYIYIYIDIYEFKPGVLRLKINFMLHSACDWMVG